MFGWEFPPHNSGGLGIACLGLTKALARERADITFVLPKKINVFKSGSKFVFADDGIEGTVKLRSVDTILMPYLTEESYRDSVTKNIRHMPEGGYGNTLIDEVKRYALRARVIAEEESFDVIHAHDWLSFLAGLEAKEVSGKPLAIHVHATEIDRTGGQGANQAIYDIEKYGMEHADKIIAVSSWVKKTIVEHYGIDPSKVIVVHNGIDTDEWRKSSIDMDALKKSGDKVVLFLGRITIQKGPEYFVRAARLVVNYFPDVTFVVAGSGDMEQQMMREVASLGLSNKFIFTGFLRGEEAAAVYQAADLFVMPSVSEPFGLVPLEAIVNGTPVLISNQSGVAEVVQNALKADFWDIEEMANQMVAVLERDSLKKTLVEHSLGEVKEITWDKAAQKCVAVYNSMVN